MKFWITLNEPRVVATLGYGAGTMAPAIGGPGTTVYVATHNLIKAHAKAYRVYDTEFRHTQKGTLFHLFSFCYSHLLRSNHISIFLIIPRLKSSR